MEGKRTHSQELNDMESQIDSSAKKSEPISTKMLALSAMVVQNVALVIAMRYTRSSTESGGPPYLASTAVFWTEVLKFAFSLLALFWECQYSPSSVYNTIQVQILHKPLDAARVLVPALLYTIQNNLLYVALTNLDAATFQITYQLKTLTTALFSVIILRKQLTAVRWVSLFVLMCGVALVQLPSSSTSVGSSMSTDATDSQVLGLMCVVGAAVSSGFSGVYFEKLIKSQAASLWIRNLLLAGFSMIIAFAGLLWRDLGFIREYGLFHGYSSIVWFVVFDSAFGGMVVAVVIKYADNIIKGFAMSFSIVLSSMISFVIFSFVPSLLWMIGAFLVTGSAVMYQMAHS